MKKILPYTVSPSLITIKGRIYILSPNKTITINYKNRDLDSLCSDLPDYEFERGLDYL